MSDKDKERYRREGMVSGIELSIAIQEAGGNVQKVTAALLDGMPMIDFLASIGIANHLKVVYAKPAPKPVLVGPPPRQPDAAVYYVFCRPKAGSAAAGSSNPLYFTGVGKMWSGFRSKAMAFDDRAGAEHVVASYAVPTDHHGGLEVGEMIEEELRPPETHVAT